MLALFLVGQLADWASTVWALSTGRFVEGNPLLYGADVITLTAVKGGAMALMLALATRLSGWRFNVAMVGMATAGAWAAGHNVGALL